MAPVLFVMVGGALGSAARYLVTLAIISRFPGAFPFGTVLVNVTGCFLIGAAMQRVADPLWQVFLVVGFLGGYTTFSSFAYQTWIASPLLGLLNVLVSVVSGYLAVWLGAAICRR